MPTPRVSPNPSSKPLAIRTGGDGRLLHVRRVLRRLEAQYEFSDLGNKDNPLDELLFFILSARTPERRYHMAYRHLRDAVGDWQNLLTTDALTLAVAIGDAGLSLSKALTVQGIAYSLQACVGAVSLDCLRDMPTPDAEAFLLTLPGVGVKIAKCVLVFSLGRPVFPIDTHCLRIARRFGWFTMGTAPTYDQAQSIERCIPPSARARLHIRLIQHGRSVCQPRQPHCERCCLADLCLTAARGPGTRA